VAATADGDMAADRDRRGLRLMGRVSSSASVWVTAGAAVTLAVSESVAGHCTSPGLPGRGPGDPASESCHESLTPGRLGGGSGSPGKIAPGSHGHGAGASGRRPLGALACCRPSSLRLDSSSAGGSLASTIQDGLSLTRTVTVTINSVAADSEPGTAQAHRGGPDHQLGRPAVTGAVAGLPA
jgi:hypothetical protein